MYQKIVPVFLRNITPMHVGTGSDLGVVDLPIQREKHTGHPKIESSGIKGCVREYSEMTAESEEDVINVHKLFGYDDKSLNCYFQNNEWKEATNVKETFKGDKGQFAGAVGFSDGRILLFPVKSAKGVFAYVTCTGVLKKLAEALTLCQEDSQENIKQVIQKINNLSMPHNDTALCLTENSLELNGKIVLDEYVYQIDDSQEESLKVIWPALCKAAGLPDKAASKMVLVHDDEFTDFVTMYTEVITRTKISNETGTVEEGALFTEEYLPAETVLYTLLLMSPSFYKEESSKKSLNLQEVEDLMNKKMKNEIVLQIGSGATIGKGIVKVRKGMGK